MANAIQQAISRLHKDDHVTVVMWDKDSQSGKRRQMTYANAKAEAAHNRHDNPIEARIIVLPAY